MTTQISETRPAPARHSRRSFLAQGAAALAAAAILPAARRALASPFNLPLGLQLYSVREQLPKDYEGTLRQIAALGYKEVEAAGFYHHSAAEVKQAMQSAGLRCVSAHYPSDDLHQRLDEIIAFHHELDTPSIVCSSPGHKTAGGGHSFTLEDWHWNADQFNTMGAKIKAAGLALGYHNHTPEFVKQDNLVPLDELIRLTDPALVTFELDCGWVVVGGGDPAAYLHKYPTRISMVHVKDFQPVAGTPAPGAPRKAAELGRGTIDYTAVFKAASKASIKHLFVEQEEFNLPPFESLKIDADYVRALPA